MPHRSLEAIFQCVTPSTAFLQDWTGWPACQEGKKASWIVGCAPAVPRRAAGGRHVLSALDAVPPQSVHCDKSQVSL